MRKEMEKKAEINMKERSQIDEKKSSVNNIFTKTYKLY